MNLSAILLTVSNYSTYRPTNYTCQVLNQLNIFSIWLTPRETIFIIFTPLKSDEILTMFLTCIAKGSSSSVILYNNGYSFRSRENEFVIRPRNVVMIDAEPQYVRSNAFFNSESRMIYINSTPEQTDEGLREVWSEIRSLYLAAIDFKQMRLQIAVRKMTDMCNSIKIKATGLSKIELHNIIKKLDLTKLKDFRHCPLLSVTQILPPYVDRDRNKTKGTIEMRLFAAICKQLNFAIKHVDLPPTESIYDVIENDKLTGCVKLLRYHEADICFGLIDPPWHPSYLVDFTLSHLETKLLFISPKPKQISQFHNVYLAFAFEVWVGILFSLIVLIIFNCLLAKYKNIPVGILILRVFAAILNYPVAYYESRIGRFIFIFFYIYAIVITSAYQSELTSLYSKIPTESAIDTLEKAIDNNITIKLFIGLQRIVFRSEQLLIQELAKRNKFVFVEPLGMPDMLINRKTAFVAEPLSVKAISPTPLNDVIMMKSELTIYHLTFFLAKDSYLKHVFNPVIVKFIESGIIQKWARDCDGQSVSTAKDDIVTLSLNSLLGAFSIWIILNLLGSIVFFCELFLNFFGKDSLKNSFQRKKRWITPLALKTMHKSNKRI